MTRQTELLKESLVAIERLEAKLAASEAAMHQPIAIVGAGCRFPGGVEDPEQLWELVRDGRDAVSEVPRDRWDAEAFYDPDSTAPGKMITKRGGFLAGIDRFEPQVFGISPREAATMDPQQRLLLETSWEALESAGIAHDRLAGSATGVFVGITTSDYGQLVRRDGVENSDVYSATGSALNAAAGRIAFTFGFQGPCVAVDTACSSSLVAVHLACQSLRAGESDLALAGGVNVVLSPDATILFSKWGMMAPDGACKTFDAAADGFVRAEGCAVIALKRLSDALAAGDPILAVIRGSAVNSDGRSSGLTVPNGPAQRAVLQKALASARLSPADIDYVEAHGTGTPLGDPIEVEALAAVMQGRPEDSPLRIGSIKTNIGHSEAVSGLAGLLKVVQSLRHEAIAPHLHFATPNPGIPWATAHVSVPTRLTPWPRGARTRRAGVSSFGFSGTNAHVILEEAPASAAVPLAVAAATLVTLSARTEPALRELARRTSLRLQADPGVSLADVALTTTTGRSHLSRRLALLADTREELSSHLAAFADGETPPGAVQGLVRAGERQKIAFLYTGQGAQYPGMGRALYESEPVFRAVLDRADAYLASRLGRSLLGVMFPLDDAPGPLSETAFTQPALFALEFATTELWRSWGITPSIVLGHSVGEYVAATVAGVMSFEDGLGLVAERARLMQALPAGGAMAALFAPGSDVSARLVPHAGRVSVAAFNGPEEIVISGDAGAVNDVVARASADGVKCRLLEVSHAFHSARLDPMLDALERRAEEVTTAKPRITLISNLSGAAFAPGAAPDAAYWRRHAREPVRFSAGIEALAQAGATAVVEVGPQPVLLGLAARALPHAAWTAVASLRRGRDDRREIRSALAALYVRGSAIAWDAVQLRHSGRRISLPTYPFQRERHWIDSQPGSTTRTTEAIGHPLLGARLDVATAPGTTVWQIEISLETHPWLRDHRVQGVAIVPATAYIEMALASGREMLEKGTLVVLAIENLKPLLLREGEQRALQATLVSAEHGEGFFSVHSRAGDSSWVQHMTARIATSAESSVDGAGSLQAAREACTTHLDGAAFYAALSRKGNEWGPCFQGTQELWLGNGEALGRVEVPPGLVAESARYCFHPAVSDSCGHALVGTIPLGDDKGATGGAFVGGGVREIRFHHSPEGTTLWAHAKLRPSAPGEERVVIGDVRVYDQRERLVGETLGARLWYLDDRSRATMLGAPDGWYYALDFRRQPLGGPGERAPKAGTWLIFEDARGLGRAVAARRAAAGARTVLVSAGEAFRVEGERATVRSAEPSDLRQLLAAFPDVVAVVHLSSLDSADGEALGAGPESVLHLLQALLEQDDAPRARLWLVTSDAQQVNAGKMIAPFGATLWGMGRAISAEHSELWGGLVDVTKEEDPGTFADPLIREIETGGSDDQIALRGGQRYVARLESQRPKQGDPKRRQALASGTYVVTGGLGGIGLEMARWLVERGARHLLLLGRTALPPRTEWERLEGAIRQRTSKILALESLGARVETASLDVAAADALQACLASRHQRGEPFVCGVIHAAGILRFEALGNETVAGMREGLAAKVAGAWNLHRAFEHDALDCFILCSSSSSLLRSPLLGVYAAGNAFLDALAHHRRAQGMTALSIDWGTWGEVGMAADAAREKQSMLTGMSVMPTESALAAMSALVESDATNFAVMPVDWKALGQAYPVFARDPVVSELVGNVEAVRTEVSRGRETSAALRRAPPAERADLLTTYLRAEAARTLGMSQQELDPATPLSSFGFDSLMAVQLKNQIEKDLRVVVPMIRFLDGPSLSELVPSVLKAMSSEPVELPVASSSPGEPWEEGSI